MFENIAELFHLNLLKKIVFSFRAQSARPGSSCCDTKKHKFYQLSRMFGHVDVPAPHGSTTKLAELFSSVERLQRKCKGYGWNMIRSTFISTLWKMVGKYYLQDILICLIKTKVGLFCSTTGFLLLGRSGSKVTVEVK